MSRTIKLTEAEYNAILAAWEGWWCHATDDGMEEPTANEARTARALERISDKWHARARRRHTTY